MLLGAHLLLVVPLVSQRWARKIPDAALVQRVLVLLRQAVNSRFRMGRSDPQALVVLAVVQVAALVDHLVLVAQY